MSVQTMEDALKPFGWAMGPAFWDRYATDPWVFHLANAVERLHLRNLELEGAVKVRDAERNEFYALPVNQEPLPGGRAGKRNVCGFVMAWRGPCQQTGHCSAHGHLKCSDKSCEDVATHDCAWASQFVCGMPWCDKHSCMGHR